jgi:enediyne biosynthesis protein E7
MQVLAERGEEAARRDLLSFFRDLSRRGGAVVEYRAGGCRAYLINDPAWAEHVLAGNQCNYANPRHEYALLAPLVTPAGAFALHLERASGAEAEHPELPGAAGWQRRGRAHEGGEPGQLREPGHRLLAGLCAHSVAATAEWLDALAPRAAAGAPLPLLLDLKALALRALAATLFGVDVRKAAPRFVAAIHRLEEFLARRPQFDPAAAPEGERRAYFAAVRDEEGFVAYLADLAVRSGRPGPWRRCGEPAMVTAMIRTLLNGFNATATALAWTLWLLALHPGSQRRLQAEVDRVLGGRPPGAADLAALGYTRDVLQESMRLYPPAWMIGRVALADDAFAGHVVRKGAIVSVSPYTLHRHPAFWERPDRYEPARFTAERGKGRPRFAYLPFGGGTRRCTAAHVAVQQLQVMLAAVVQRYELHPVPGRPTRPLPLISLRPHPDVMLRLASR